MLYSACINHYITRSWNNHIMHLCVSYHSMDTTQHAPCECLNNGLYHHLLLSNLMHVYTQSVAHTQHSQPAVVTVCDSIICLLLHLPVYTAVGVWLVLKKHYALVSYTYRIQVGLGMHQLKYSRGNNGTPCDG